MSPSLHDELDRLADSQPPFHPDPALWDRGRRGRRRTRAAAAAAALAVVAVVGGVVASPSLRPNAVAPAGEVPEGAVPSRIEPPTGPVRTDLALGRASVAYLELVDGSSPAMPVLVDAETGESIRVELPDFPEVPVEEMEEWFHGPWLALSPDGERLGYPVTSQMERDPGQMVFQTSWYRVVDLTTGESELVDVPPGTGTPRGISWTADGRLAVDLYGRPTRPNRTPPLESWTFDPQTGASSTSPLTGVVAPGVGISATYPTTDERVGAVPFRTATGTDPSRELPADLYPDGAAVTPVGWADNSLHDAHVDAPDGSYVEGPHVALFTSPDRPDAEWTYRILVRDVPETPSISVAVDLVPDLDGSSSQALTHDFGEPAAHRTPWWERLSYWLGALALLFGLPFAGYSAVRRRRGRA